MSMDEPNRTNNHQPPWRLAPLAAIAVIAALLAWAELGPSADRVPTTSPLGRATTGKTVELSVETADGALRRYPRLAWQPGMTVGDALQQARARPHGLEFEVQGAGSAAFVLSIGGQAGEGGGAEARQWIYWVNGVAAQESFATQTLEPGDRILWKFIRFE